MHINPFRFKKIKKRYEQSEGFLKPETKRAIAAVILIIFSLITTLSFISEAGPAGAFILHTLRQLFGIAAYAVPFVCILLGIHLVRPNREPLSRLRIVGIALLAIGFLGSYHLVRAEVEDAYQTALEGRGSGLVGFMFAYPLSKAFSRWAAIFLFLGSFVVGLFLALNTSLKDIWGWIKSMSLVETSRDGGTEDVEAESDSIEEDTGSQTPLFRIGGRRDRAAAADPNQLRLQSQQQAREKEQYMRVRQHVRAANRRYRPPSLDLLHSSVGKPNSGDIEKNKENIRATLEKFGIAVTMGKVNVGPTVAQYTLRPDEGVKLSKITQLQDNLALALAAHPIRIEAPIPNTNLVGIEIPNKNVSTVRLRDLLLSREFRRAESPLTVVLGKDVAGNVKIAVLDNMPHLLIAGATGSGKSIFINTLILSLLYRNSPALLRFIMVDPKRVELPLYNGIPHLLTPVIVEPDKTIHALKWAVREMDKRYRLLSESGARNLMSFNANNPDEALPMIIIVIDELAHLMTSHARDVEGVIVRLSQMARAIGIYLVLATQRPSVNVITGLIKANIPTRVAFSVASQVDSRTILDAAGAEKLLGNGDMLYLPGEQAKPVRLQGCFVSEEEVRQVVRDINEKNPSDAEYDESIVSISLESSAVTDEAVDDVLFEDAKQLVLSSRKASASFLQRRLRVGYARAARLLDILEEQGIIGPGEGNKPREILPQKEEDIMGGKEPEEPYGSNEEGQPRHSDSPPW